MIDWEVTNFDPFYSAFAVKNSVNCWEKKKKNPVFGKAVSKQSYILT